MNEHTFGGNWTEEKLGRLDKYLTTYRTIFANNEKAKHFRTWYVDAFAGTGSRSEPNPSLGLTYGIPAFLLQHMDDRKSHETERWNASVDQWSCMRRHTHIRDKQQ